MSEIQDDKKVLKGKRKNPLKDTDEVKVTAPLRDQIVEKLLTKLEEDNTGEVITRMWTAADADRVEFMTRQAAFLQEIDEFIDPIYDQALDWSSTLHLPTILTVCKTYHARMYTALLGIDPPFTVRSRSAANVERAELVEQLMRYTLKDWCNKYDGISTEADRWIWEWITRGRGILKGRWHQEFSRFIDVEVTQIPAVKLEMDPETGDSVPVPTVKEVEKEVSKTITVFDGPMVECVPLDDVIIVGGEGDAQKADAVLHRSFYTASELWTKADQGIFKRSVVEEIINAGKDSLAGNDSSTSYKQLKIEQAGESMIDKEHQLDRYEVIEAYIKKDVDGSGINADLIVWVHKTSRKILRATYLRRVMPLGTRPFFVIDFHKRFGSDHSAGLVELIYSLGKEIDAIHNMKVDVGILSSMPIGFYRPTAASLKDERLPLEPGALIPVDNPQTDIYFPNMGMRTGFMLQEEQALQTQIERLTAISDLSLGVLGAQGVARTATGARALLGEASNNLSIYIERMGRGWKQAIKYLFHLLQYRLPPGFQFRISGDDGNSYWRIVESRDELAGMYDFEIDSNSANSNKQIQIEQANMIYQVTSNPIDLQLGLVSPSERYEAIANMLRANGVKNVSKFIRKPTQIPPLYSPVEIADRILQGVDVTLDPTQDLQGFIQLVQEFVENEELNGQFNHNQIALLVGKAQEAQGLLQALQQAQAQAQAIQQQQMNSMATQMPANSQPPSISQAPAPGEGG
jgi:hypothetical protein